MPDNAGPMNQRHVLTWVGIVCAAAVIVLVAIAVIGTITGRVQRETIVSAPTATVSFTAVASTREPPAPTRTEAVAPTTLPPTTEPAAVSPLPTVVERRRVADTGGAGLSLRTEPRSAGERLKIVPDGAELELTGDEQEADGRTWRAVRDPSDGTAGWVATEFPEAVAAD